MNITSETVDNGLYTNNSFITLIFTFNKEIQNFSESDITVIGATISSGPNLINDNKTYSATFKNTTEGNNSVSVSGDNLEDLVGNRMTQAYVSYNWTYDITPPSIILYGGPSITITTLEAYNYTYDGAYFIDSDDTEKIATASGTLGTTVGNYTLSYSATDMAGNVGTNTQTVNVVYASFESNDYLKTAVNDYTGTDTSAKDKVINDYSEINTWVFSSSVNSFKELFSGKSIFNENISNWDTSNITDMSNMFKNASSFNQDISNWDVSNVTDFTDMFLNANSLSEDNRIVIHNSWIVKNPQYWQIPDDWISEPTEVIGYNNGNRPGCSAQVGSYTRVNSIVPSTSDYLSDWRIITGEILGDFKVDTNSMIVLTVNSSWHEGVVVHFGTVNSNLKPQWVRAVFKHTSVYNAGPNYLTRDSGQRSTSGLTNYVRVLHQGTNGPGTIEIYFGPSETSDTSYIGKIYTLGT